MSDTTPLPPIDEGQEAEAVKIGARNSAADQARIQTIHDSAVGLGADCSGEADSKSLAEVAEPGRVYIKALTDEHAIVAGYGIVYGGRDLVGETFTPDTDLWPDLVPAKVVLYDHTMGEVKHALGRVIEEVRNARGVWIEAQLERNRDYVEEILELVQAGALGWSSGSIGHLVQRSAGGIIKSWPVVEYSLTPTPAEPRTLGVQIIKALSIDNPRLEALVPEAESAAARATAAEPSIQLIESEETNVSDEIKNTEPQAPDEVAALKTQVENLGAAVERLLGYMESAPAVAKSGYFTVDGGAADPDIKSLGDWLLAVKRRDHKRLTQVYKSRPDYGATKDLSGTQGTHGGYLVPEEYSAQLLQIAQENDPLLSLVTRVPVRSDHGSFPALDQFAAPTAGAGNTALAGQVSAALTKPGGTLTETNARFKAITYTINKVGGYTEVENELIEDSPIAVETLLRALFAVAVGAKMSHYILRGSGAGEPLGILNANAAIGIAPDTNNTFALDDASEMMSRWKAVGPNMGARRWLWHPGIWPDVVKFETTGGGAVFQANLSAGSPGNLFGIPYLVNEHLPQDDNSGCVVLADLSAYVLFVRNELSIAYSEHAAFTSDKGTWKFTQRCDGRPWVSNTITLADPQGSFTCSPFVYLND